MLSESRARALINSLNSAARKVFDAVPAAEAWSITHIQAEINRVGGNGRDVRMVHGCLAQLVSIGLIHAPKGGLFQRVAVREASKPQTQENDEAMPDMPSTTPAAAPRSPVAILSPLVDRLRTLADDIETAALEVEEAFSTSRQDGEKLRQLQALLKGIGQ